MEENVGIGIQARILPQIEGAVELEQQMEQITSRLQSQIANTINQTQQTPVGEVKPFMENLTPQQQRLVNMLSTGDMLEIESFKEQQEELLEDLRIDTLTGSMGKPQLKKHLRRFEKHKSQIDELQDFYIEQINDPDLNLPQIKKDALIGVVGDWAQEAKDKIDQAKQSLIAFNDSLKESRQPKEQTLFEQIKSMSLPAIGGAVVNETLNWIRTGAEIEAKERTSFDFTSPIAMYQTRQEAELFRTTREREREYTTGGMVLGAAGGLALSAVTGGAAAPFVLGGMVAGGMFGGQIAGIQNIEERAIVEEQLKLLQQSYGTINSYVGATSNYDILRARTRARLGGEAVGSIDLGYDPEQELQMRLAFSKARGVFTEDSFREQTTFARALGLDPNEIYGLNLSSRVTGQDVSMKGLIEGRQLASQIFGPEAANNRVLDILEEIKRINETMLRVNVDADSREAMRFAKLPGDIFGIDNPYGRLGDLGGQTIKILEGLMQPKSGAHESFLFNVLGDQNIMEFAETMKGGIYDSNNFMKIMEGLNKFTGGSEYLNYMALNEMMPGAPKGFIPQLAKLTSGEGVEITRYKTEGIDEKTGDVIFAKNEKGEKIKETVIMTLDKLIAEQNDYAEQIKRMKEEGKLTEEEYTKALDQQKQTQLGYYNDLATDMISQTEDMIVKVKEKQIEAADLWREPIKEINTKTAEFWGEMAKLPGIIKLITDAATEGLEDFDLMRRKKGLMSQEENDQISKHRLNDINIEIENWKKAGLPVPQKLTDEKELLENKSRAADESLIISPHRTEDNQIISPHREREKDLIYQESKEQEKKFGELKDSGWHEYQFDMLKWFVRESGKFEGKYDVRMSGPNAGYDEDQTHHGFDTPGGYSKHFTGDAMDVSLYQHDSGKLIPANKLPPEVIETFKNFAAFMGIEYGGNYEKKDWNHFEKADSVKVPTEELNTSIKGLNSILDSLKSNGLKVEVMINGQPVLALQNNLVGL